MLGFNQIGKTVRHIRRYQKIAGVLFKYGLGEWVGASGWNRFFRYWHFGRMEPDVKVHRLTPPQRLRMAMQELGPAFIKIGQLLSARSDLIPEEFSEELSQLQDNASTLPFEEIRKMVEGELEQPLEEVFDQFNPECEAAASMAQVHRARLKTGEDVAVKVQRPGLESVVRVDMEILHQIAVMMEERFESFRFHRLSEVIRHFSEVIHREMDFMIEASNMERFAWQFREHEQVYVPKVYRRVSTSRVLTMEFVVGTKCSKLSGGEAVAGIDRRACARNVARLMMRQIFEQGFFHGDPHPGNLVFMKHQRVCFLDFGIMGYLDSHTRTHLADFLWGISSRDDARIVNGLIHLTRSEDEVDRKALEADISEFVQQSFYRPLRDLEVGKFLDELLRQTAKHQMRIPANLFMMIKALSSSEGAIRMLDPEYDLIKEAGPFLRTLLADRLNPKNVFSKVMLTSSDFMDVLHEVRKIPSDFSHFCRQFKNGQIKVHVEHADLMRLVRAGERISNRIAFALVLAACLIGSSLIVLADVPPKVSGMPIIGLVGYLFSAIMGFGILFSIIRRGML